MCIKLCVINNIIMMDLIVQPIDFIVHSVCE